MSIDLRTVRRAEVYKAGRPAATMTRGDGTVTFAYLGEYDGQPVAHTLPLGATVTTHGGDATQLLGRYPADKYALTSEEAAAAIADACAARPVAARAVFQQFALAWLTGNGDLHGKNLSVLQQPSGEWRVAPIYDVASTLPYGDRSMALSLQGATEGLTRRRFVTFGSALGLPARAVESALAEVPAATDSMLHELEGGALPWNANLRRTVVRQLGRRRDLLA